MGFTGGPALVSVVCAAELQPAEGCQLHGLFCMCGSWVRRLYLGVVLATCTIMDSVCRILFILAMMGKNLTTRGGGTGVGVCGSFFTRGICVLYLLCTGCSAAAQHPHSSQAQGFISQIWTKRDQTRAPCT